MAKENPKEIKRLRKELIKTLEWGLPEQWHSSMFTELSQKIFEAAQLRLSTATLKRFFGVVNHQGAPSITTLDALSRFLGFENWRSFKQSRNRRLLGFGKAIPYQSIYVIFGFVLALVMISLIANRLPTEPVLPPGITFSSRPLTNTYPNSVVFDFNLQNIQTDSLHIQQYWDPTKTIAINKDQKQATGIYYFPGYFQAKLVIDGKTVREHPLFLRSNGWLGTIEYEPVPKYFTPESDAATVLSYPSRLAPEIASSASPLITAYHYINDLGEVSGDDFQLEASIKNTFDEKWAVCQASWIYLIGTDGAMIIPFSKMGCSAKNNLMLNDLYLNGKEHDLSAFATTLEDFTTLRIINQNKSVQVFIRGQEVYAGQYRETMGNLVGLRFKFLGLGEVEHFSLLDQNGNTVVF